MLLAVKFTCFSIDTVVTSITVQSSAVKFMAVSCVSDVLSTNRLKWLSLWELAREHVS